MCVCVCVRVCVCVCVCVYVCMCVQGPDVIVHQPDMVLDAMGEWCKENHGKVSVWLFLCRAVTVSQAYAGHMNPGTIIIIAGNFS